MYKYRSIQNEFDRRMMLLGLSNKELSQKLNITFQHLSSIRHGKVTPSPALAKRISDTLEVSINDIFTIENKKEE